MKKIEAFIKSHRLTEVSRALSRIEGLTGMTVVDARGFGRGGIQRPNYKSLDKFDSYKAIARLEVFCKDELAETVVSTIEHTAHTGLRGDGKIYVMPVDGAARISTGERDDAAV